VTPWERRARRAQFLADSFPAVREILTFYAGLAEWQGSVASQLTGFNQAVSAIPSLLDYVKASAPAPLAQAARDFQIGHADAILRSYWEGRSDLSLTDFFARAALQPYAASLPEGLDCPWCAKPPQAGCLHAQSDGLAFKLVCALCLRRRSFPRTRCPACNESAEAKIASFTAPEYPHLRLLACETCKGYLLVVDLNRDPSAIPEVDELAGLSLDLWAGENGYHKLQPNLAGV
jgi:formate dehydrogenase maturation protein FdhE